jgi:hypothetical protein
VGPLRGTRYGMYAANWTYGRGKEGTFLALGLTDEDVGLLRGVDCDILTQGLI